MQYSIIYYSLSEVTHDAVSDVAVGEVVLDVQVKVSDSRANYSSDMRPAHFVVDNGLRSQWHKAETPWRLA